MRLMPYHAKTGRSRPLIAWLYGWMTLMGVKASYLGVYKVSEFSCDEPIKEAHCNKKILNLRETPQTNQ